MNPMNPLQEIFDAIAAEDFSVRVVALIDNYINDILYGKTSFPRFNLSEHAGVCTGGAALIGASVVACYARASLEASANAGAGQDGGPCNWEIDELHVYLYDQVYADFFGTPGAFDDKLMTIKSKNVVYLGSLFDSLDKRVMQDRGIIWQMRKVLSQHRSKEWKKERIYQMLTDFAASDFKQ